MICVWSVADLADVIERVLRCRVEQHDLEQTVRGLDSCTELQLHAIIADGLLRSGLGVHREQRYPLAKRSRRKSEGNRCDFVLTPDARPLRHPDQVATLFDSEDAVDFDQALWLEMKAVGQFTAEGPNARYASELLSPVFSDVRKLSSDREILHAAVLLILFTADEHVAQHDLRVWEHRCIERGLPIGAPSTRTIALQNRLGNSACTAAVYPVHHW